MSLRVSLIAVPLLLAGCQRALLVVDDPAASRVAKEDLDKVRDREGKQVTEAREQLRRAQDELAAARRAVDAEAAEQRAAVAATRAARAALEAARRGTDQRAIDQAQLDVVVAEEGERVQQHKAAWLDAQLAWRERNREATEKRVAAAEAKRELARAELVARVAPANEPFDVAPYRGQQGRLHQEWSNATARVAVAHAEVDKREGELAAAKQRYATARQVVLPAPVIVTDGKTSLVTPAAAPPPDKK
jgi:hypothetical protein